MSTQVSTISPGLAPEYASTGTSYAIGDVVLHDNAYYKCTTAITAPAGTWNSSKWELVDEAVKKLTQKADASDLPYSLNSAATYPNRTIKLITVSGSTSVTLPTLPASGTSAIYDFGLIVNATALSTDVELSLTSASPVYYSGGAVIKIKAGARTMVDVLGVPGDAWYALAANDMKTLTTNT